MSRALTAGAVAEFIGTFALMFVGGAAIIQTGGENLLVIALAHGLILAVMVCAAMQISGGQFNPAVSIALAAIGKQPVGKAALFILAQIAGAVVAAMLLVQFFDSDAVNSVKLGATLGQYTTGEAPKLSAAFGLEVICTFFLMFTIMGVAVDKRGSEKNGAVAGIAIGLCIVADILAIGPLTGASMNPARTLGPVIAGTFAGIEGVAQSLWLYMVAPLVGALACALLWKTVIEEKDDDEAV